MSADYYLILKGFAKEGTPVLLALYWAVIALLAVLRYMGVLTGDEPRGGLFHLVVNLFFIGEMALLYIWSGWRARKLSSG